MNSEFDYMMKDGTSLSSLINSENIIYRKLNEKWSRNFSVPEKVVSVFIDDNGKSILKNTTITNHESWKDSMKNSKESKNYAFVLFEFRNDPEIRKDLKGWICKVFLKTYYKMMKLPPTDLRNRTQFLNIIEDFENKLKNMNLAEQNINSIDRHIFVVV